MDRLAHFHFIIIFSSHRWSSASFCFVRSFVRSFVPLARRSSPRRGGRSLFCFRSDLSFSPGINTHGGTGRAGGATPEPSMSFEMELTTAAGQKIAEREILLPGTAFVLCAPPTVDNTEPPDAVRSPSLISPGRPLSASGSSPFLSFFHDHNVVIITNILLYFKRYFRINEH